MEPFKEYTDYDALGLAELVEDGEVLPVELVEAAAARIRELNPTINAVISSRVEEALVEAASSCTTDGEKHGPFTGVPTLIKDLVVEEGTPVTFGSVFFADHVGDTTSAFRKRVGDAGFIELGRTNTPEFGLLPTTEPVLHGPTLNPWDLSRSAGGSSGGAAAAVAAGVVPLAQGSDGGGSIRIPASACGLFGMKPSRGRNPRRPGGPVDYLSVEHALTRTVRDSAAFLDAVHSPTHGDRYYAPQPESSFADAVKREPSRLRVAFSTVDFRGENVHPECERAVRETAELLESLGHDVVEEAPAIDGDLLATAFIELWAALAGTGLALVLDGAAEVKPILGHIRRYFGDWRTIKLISSVVQRRSGSPAFEPFTCRLAQRSWKRSQYDLMNAEVALQSIAHTTGAFLTEHDVFLTPVLGSPPVRIGEIDQNLEWDDFIEMIFRYVAFTPIGNFAGMPAMSVPLHWSDNGLPIGSHFMGRFGEEELLFSLAGQLERAKPWRDRRPPLFG